MGGAVVDTGVERVTDVLVVEPVVEDVVVEPVVEGGVVDLVVVVGTVVDTVVVDAVELEVEGVVVVPQFSTNFSAVQLLLHLA